MENYDEYRTEQLEFHGDWEDELKEWNDHEEDMKTNPWGV